MKQKLEREQIRGIAIKVLAITTYALIAALNYKSFVLAGDLFPGGFAGITRLVQRCALEYAGVVLPFAPVNFVLNLVPAVVSYRFIGKNFTLYSCLGIVLTGIFTDLIPAVPITEDILLICVFGGLISGFSASLCLQVRVTGGGTDFIAIALAEQKNVDAWNYILAGNAVMLVVAGALFGWDKALYSIIFQYTSTQVVRLLDPDGKRVTLFIVTKPECANDVYAQIQDTRHSATRLEGTGLYNGQPCVMLYTVVTNSQVRQLAKNVRQVDPNAFVNVMRTEKLMGRFYRIPRD